jgi:hypothetical protein
MTRALCHLALMSFALIVCMAVFSPRTVPQELPPRSVSTGVAEGNTWLSWDPKTRLGFVSGYLVGIRAGNRGGCFWYDNFTKPKSTFDNPADTPLAKCLQNVPLFSKPPDYYQKQITNFYEIYPSDRGLNLESLLSQLSGKEGKSLKDIDAWFRAASGRSD